MKHAHKIRLQSVLRPVSRELEKTEEVFSRLAGSELQVVGEIHEHISNYRGKRLRPVLLLLCSGLSGGITVESIEAAAAVELLHTTTLIHDDVVDQSDLRRGGPTVHSIWGNRTAVLTGDIFFARVLTWLVELDIPGVTAVISSAIRQVCEGELIQSRNGTGDSLITEEEYFRTITLKTASLIAASCELGVMTSSGSGNGERAVASRYGRHLGIAFQIRDDLMDYNGRRDIMGKPAGNDISGCIVTLPLLYGLKYSGNGDRGTVLSMIRDGVKEEDEVFIRGFVERSGGIAYAREKAEEHVRTALSYLELFPESEYKDSMSQLAEFVIERDF